MGRTCTICRDERREEIDLALIAGDPYRTIAKTRRLSEAAMFRHKKNHLTQALVRSKKAQEVVQSDRLMDRLRQLHAETMGILREALDTDDNRLALQAVGRAAKLLELEARLLGELDESTKVLLGVKVERPRSEYDLSRLDMGELETLELLLEKAMNRDGFGPTN